MSEKRLIDANELIKVFEHKLRNNIFPLCVISTIEETPTVDPIKHAKWIQPDKEHEFNDLYRCSDCYYLGDWHDLGKNYCPNCGARMDGE